MNMKDWTAVDCVAIEEARRAADACGHDASTADRLRAAMTATHKHWLLIQEGRSEGRELRCAVAGVCLALGEDHPDWQRITAEHKALAKLGAVLDALRSGVAVDVEASLVDAAMTSEPVGLMRIWREVEAAERRTTCSL
jgi:hypothetical protein